MNIQIQKVCYFWIWRIMMESSNIGDRLLLLRKKNNVSQSKVAEAVGIKLSTYRSIESGRTMGRVETLAMLSEYFNVSLDYLVLGKEVTANEIGMLFCNLSKEQQKAFYIALQTIIDAI